MTSPEVMKQAVRFLTLEEVGYCRLFAVVALPGEEADAWPVPGRLGCLPEARLVVTCPLIRHAPGKGGVHPAGCRAIRGSPPR
jgi:hypothetical protein